MGSGPDKSTMHVVEGHPRKEAVITVLEPRSPYRPWRADDFEPIKDGDRVVAVLDTDPVSVLATVGFVGADGDVQTTPSARCGARSWSIATMEPEPLPATTGERLGTPTATARSPMPSANYVCRTHEETLEYEAASHFSSLPHGSEPRRQVRI
jgi:hypothetical protein